MRKTIIITSPSLNEDVNVSGISTITKFIISNNKNYDYSHFEIGKTDDRKRGVPWFLNIVRSFIAWCGIMIFKKNIIVHFNFPLEQRAIIRDAPFIIIARLLGKKMIIHLHGGKYLMQDPPGWIKRILKIVLTKKEPKIVLSKFEKEVVSKKFNISNVYVLPNSVELEEAKVFQHLYRQHGPLNLLFMGRIVESKGMKYIYEACVLLQQKGIGFNLFLAGKGPDEIAYIDQFSALLKNQFNFKGVVSGKEKIALIKQCDIFLLPSVFGEGLPMALLESMSFGLVPITTDDGSMADLVKSGVTGFIIKKNSAKDIADAIIELNSNRILLKSLGENSKKIITNNYDPDSYIKELNLIYNFAS